MKIRILAIEMCTLCCLFVQDFIGQFVEFHHVISWVGGDEQEVAGFIF